MPTKKQDVSETKETYLRRVRAALIIGALLRGGSEEAFPDLLFRHDADASYATFESDGTWFNVRVSAVGR